MATDPEPQSHSEHNPPKKATGESGGKWLLGLAGLAAILGAVVRRLLSNRTKAVTSQSALAAGEKAAPAVPIRDHERRDANAKWIFAVVLFLLVCGLGMHGILAWFLSMLKQGPPPTDRWSPIARVALTAPALPAFPTLQVSPPADLKMFWAAEDAELHSYGWINRTSGIVRIPIERAMDLVLQEGLPARASNNQSQLGPSTYQLMQQRANHHQPEIQGEK